MLGNTIFKVHVILQRMASHDTLNQLFRHRTRRNVHYAPKKRKKQNQKKNTYRDRPDRHSPDLPYCTWRIISLSRYNAETE